MNFDYGAISLFRIQSTPVLHILFNLKKYGVDSLRFSLSGHKQESLVVCTPHQAYYGSFFAQVKLNRLIDKPCL